MTWTSWHRILNYIKDCHHPLAVSRQYLKWLKHLAWSVPPTVKQYRPPSVWSLPQQPFQQVDIKWLTKTHTEKELLKHVIISKRYTADLLSKTYLVFHETNEVYRTADARSCGLIEGLEPSKGNISNVCETRWHVRPKHVDSQLVSIDGQWKFHYLWQVSYIPGAWFLNHQQNHSNLCLYVALGTWNLMIPYAFYVWLQNLGEIDIVVTQPLGRGCI